MSDIDSMPAGPAMNRMLAELVMGWRLYHYDKGGPGSEYWSLIDADGNAVPDSTRKEWHTAHASAADAFAWFSPSTNIAQAWDVIERMSDTCSFHLHAVDGEWSACFAVCDTSGKAWVSEGADTAPLAICRAALKAVAS